MTKKTPQETRQKLINAALSLLVQADANHFTLDAIALEANVSKGGLLHHFPTKESLLKAIIEYSEQLWYERLAHEIEQEPEGVPGRWCRAYIRATFDSTQQDKDLNVAFAKLRNLYAELLVTLENKQWRTTSDDGLPAGRALMIQLTCDGIWFAEIAGAAPLSAQEIALVRSELERLT